jgi:cytochrome c oxidase subunit IV
MATATTKEARMRKGARVFALLAVLTAVEYVLTLPDQRVLLLPPLVALALAKAWLILDNFMHVRDLFGPEEG